VIADRTLPLLYVHEMQNAGIAVDLDPDLGVLDRRVKDEEELSDRLDEMQDELKDNNVVDATTRFTRLTKKDDNETD
jgi:fructose-bisphosphate aldolase class 1